MTAIKKVLFVRSPRFYFDYFSFPDYFNFQLPLGLSSVATFLKHSSPKVDVEIVDCPATKMGWKTLAEIMRIKKPDIVAAGEPQFFYFHETMKVFELAKKISPHIHTIAGGLFFSAMAELILTAFQSVDYCVLGEAELTVSELIETIAKNENPESVRGIALKKNEHCIFTAPRPLLKNLDLLPIPDYTMLPMKNYHASFFPHFIPSLSSLIETSRGCTFKCDFCNLWRFWGENQSEKTLPFFRRKSVERAIEEVQINYEKFGRRFIFITDPTFNTSQEWTNRFCELLLKKDYRNLKWFAYLRPDSVIKDENNGILEKMTRSGLSVAFLGGERCPKSSEKYDGKTEEIEKAVSIFREKYPGVQTCASFLIGAPKDSYQELINVSRYALKIRPTYLFMGFVPFPGTTLWDEYLKMGEPARNIFSKLDYPEHRFFSNLNARINPMYKKFPFSVIVWTNTILAQRIALLYNTKNIIFRSWADILSKIIYKNKICFILFNLLFVLTRTAYLMIKRGSVSFKMIWVWRKPSWYNS